MREYSFCETNAAITWHIRPLTSAGRKLGGGADSNTLCGLKPSWDRIPTVNSISTRSACKECRTKWLEDGNAEVLK